MIYKRVSSLFITASLLSACGVSRDTPQIQQNNAKNQENVLFQSWDVHPIEQTDLLNKLSRNETSLVGITFAEPVDLLALLKSAAESNLTIRTLYYKSPFAQGTYSLPEAVSPTQVELDLMTFFQRQSDGALTNVSQDISTFLQSSIDEQVDLRNVGQIKKFMRKSDRHREATVQILSMIDNHFDARDSASSKIIYGVQIKGNTQSIKSFSKSLPVAGIETDNSTLFSTILPLIPKSLDLAAQLYLNKRNSYRFLSDNDIAKTIAEFKKFGTLYIKNQQSSRIRAQLVSGSGTPYPNRGTLYYSPRVSVDAGGFQKDEVRFTLAWDSPGGWWVGPARGDNLNHSGIYEMDFVESTPSTPAWPAGCISRSDLPEPYDDCPTSGSAENAPNLSHGLGSWNASAIVTSQIYNAVIELTRVRAKDSTVFVSWQTLQHNLCGSTEVNPSNPVSFPSQPGKTYYTCKTNWNTSTPEPFNGSYCNFRSTERNIWCVIGARSGTLLSTQTVTSTLKTSFPMTNP